MNKEERKALKKELMDKKKEELRMKLEKYRNHPKVRQMKTYTQHGSITTYDHCERVASMSLKINRNLQKQVHFTLKNNIIWAKEKKRIELVEKEGLS